LAEEEAVEAIAADVDFVGFVSECCCGEIGDRIAVQPQLFKYLCFATTTGISGDDNQEDLEFSTARNRLYKTKE
jgi:hypothetical protein